MFWLFEGYGIASETLVGCDLLNHNYKCRTFFSCPFRWSEVVLGALEVLVYKCFGSLLGREYLFQSKAL